MEKECVLYDRKCINCGECDICDLNPKKICDNCGMCIESGNDYNIVDVDLTVQNGDEPLNYHFEDEDFEEDDEPDWFTVYAVDDENDYDCSEEIWTEAIEDFTLIGLQNAMLDCAKRVYEERIMKEEN